MEFITSVGATFVGEIAKYTIVPIGRELGYLCCYKRNRNNLSKQIQELQQKKTSVDDEVRKARTKGREPTEAVEAWFAEVARECQTGNEFLGNEDHEKAKCQLFSNLWLRRKLSMEAQKMAKIIASVNEKASSLSNNISKIPSLQCSFNNRNFEDLDSRMRSLREIMEAIKDPSHRMIGVYGAGGIGKTTLVTEVAKMAQKEGLFTKVVMVTMSETFEVGVKQKEIAEKLGLEMIEETVPARAERLKNGLRRQEKILIILDDIWESKVPDLSKDIGIDFKDEQSNCKVVLVSRDKSVLQNLMGVNKNIKLQFLTDHEAMNLFKKFVGGTIYPGFESSAASLVEECGGLPIAIVTIACALKNRRDIRVWKDTLRKLESSPKEGYGKAYTSIRTSYDYLESEQEKMVLLLCSLHEEDANIHVENLMSIYGALCNFFHRMDTLEEARDSVHALVERLKERCLLLDGDSPDTVKMHDVIRDIMGSIAYEDKGMHRFADFPKFGRFLEQGVLKESSSISVLRCDFYQLREKLVCPKLEFLLLGHKYPFVSLNREFILIPGDYFEATKELKVLWLRSLLLGSLPQSLCFLQNIRTLSFQNCQLEDIALIGELKNLIVLDLSHSDFKLLPEQIGKLNSLRQLNLNNCESLKVISPNVISSLVHLEDLYMDSVYIDWGHQVRVKDGRKFNASLIELKNLKRLRDLHLYIRDTAVIPTDGFVNECLERYHIMVGKDYLSRSQIKFSSLCWLIVHGFRKLKQLVPSGICGSLTQLERLEISDCPMMEELIAVNELAGGARSTKILLTKLNYFELKNLTNLKRFVLGDCMMECESLLELKIHNCPKLEALITSSLCTSTRVDKETQQPLFSDNVSFPRLEDLSIFECHRLKYLLACSAARQLSELKRLELKFCTGIEEIIVVIMEKTTISFPKLQSLQLLELSNLKRISSSNCVIECPYLVELKLQDCPQLGPSDIGSSMFSLIKEEKIQVGEKACTADAQSLANKKVTLKQLLQLSDQTSFGNLHKLTIYGCKTLRYLFHSSAVENLSNLNELSIHDCKVIEAVVATMSKELGKDQQILFSKLKHLTLEDLPKLKSFCEAGRVECPSLLQLKIKDCESLRTFVADSARSPKQTVEQQVTQQPLFNHKVAFSHLEELIIDGKWANAIWWRQYSAILPFPKLKVIQSLCLEGCDQKSFVPFDIHICQKIKKISLTGILVEKIIWQHREDDNPATRTRPTMQLFDGNQIHQSLETLTVRKCVRLRSLLISSSISFSNLTFLEVSECREMVNLLSASTAKSLIQLKKMSIYDCEKMTEVIIGNKEGEAESSSGVVFNQLETLTLNNLPSLKIFHGGNSNIQFPVLKKFIASKCPEMETFSNLSTNAPKLNQVITELEFSSWSRNPEHARGTGKIWDGDLNKTVREIWEISFGIALQRLFSETVRI